MLTHLQQQLDKGSSSSLAVLPPRHRRQTIQVSGRHRREIPVAVTTPIAYLPRHRAEGAAR